MPGPEPERFAADRLHEFAVRVLRGCGVADADAALAAEVLLSADRRGIDSHGIARLADYARALDDGRVNARPRIRIVAETPATARVDGDRGLGLVVAPRANEIAMDKAQQAGAGWVAVGNSHHYGIAGWYVLQAVERGLIGWSMTNATALVSPLWGRGRMLGTNPIAVGVPAGSEPAFVLDMATSTVALGKLEMSARRGEAIPEGWALDAEGRPTTDAHAVDSGGALLPLGGTRDLGGHKGYGLAGLVDILSGVLSGANFGPWVVPFTVNEPAPTGSVGDGLGHFLGALRVDAFLPREEFGRRMDHWIGALRATPAAPGTPGVMIPGDPEREAERERARDGIPLLAPVVQRLRGLARAKGIAFD